MLCVLPSLCVLPMPSQAPRRGTAITLCPHNPPPTATHMSQVDPRQGHPCGCVKGRHEAIRQVHRQAQQAAVVTGHQGWVLHSSKASRAAAKQHGMSQAVTQHAGMLLESWVGHGVWFEPQCHTDRLALRQSSCGAEPLPLAGCKQHPATTGRLLTPRLTCSISMWADSMPPTARMVSSNTCTRASRSKVTLAASQRTAS